MNNSDQQQVPRNKISKKRGYYRGFESQQQKENTASNSLMQNVQMNSSTSPVSNKEKETGNQNSPSEVQRGQIIQPMQEIEDIQLEA